MDLSLETIRVLRRFKNAVLEGAPGTGKSHVVTAVANNWQAQTGRPLVGNGRGAYAMTLHPNTTYEEFVEGLRYDDQTQAFRRRDGFLRSIVTEARANPKADFLVLIDELNRANVPKVLGDLLLTMEASKRATWDGSEWVGGMEVTLPYSGRQFSVPSNVYLLGTMNTSDRSIAPLDSALRRRFGFIRVEPLVGDFLRAGILEADGQDAVDRVDRSIDELTNLNEALRRCLGPDALIGHSYLFGVTATEGTAAAPDDPLAVLREELDRQDVTGALWLEVGGMWGGNHNQLDLPDETQSRRGLVDFFYPLTSAGITRSQRSGVGTQDALDITLSGMRFDGNTIEYNSGGSNVRLKYQGRNSAGDGIHVAAPADGLEQKVHVWLRLTDGSFELLLFSRSSEVLAALRSVSSVPNGWHERTPGAKGRSYGVVDPDAVQAVEAGTTPRSADDDAEWMIWRYAILPQLIDTATQVGATEVLDRELRSTWLETAGASDVADRWEKFDAFLASLSLAIREEGYGLTRGLAVIDIPAGAAGEYLPPTSDDDTTIDTQVVDENVADDDDGE